MIWPPQDSEFFAPPRCMLCELIETEGYRSRGNVFELCGIPESPSMESSPPKFYRKWTVSGTSTADAGGTETGRTDLYEASGAKEFNAMCEVVSDTAQVRWRQWNEALAEGDNCRPAAQTEGNLTEDLTTPVEYTTWATTPVSSTVSGMIYFGPEYGCPATDALIATRSIEDTETDALARFRALNSFTGYSDPEITAYWGVRTGDHWYVNFREVEWRVQRSGLLPSTSYTVSVEIWRRTYDQAFVVPPSAWVLYAIQEETAATDATGCLEIVALTPNDPGYESYAKASTFSVDPT